MSSIPSYMLSKMNTSNEISFVFYNDKLNQKTFKCFGLIGIRNIMAILFVQVLYYSTSTHQSKMLRGFHLEKMMRMKDRYCS